MDALTLERCRLCPHNSSLNLVQDALAADEISEIAETVEQVSSNPRTAELLAKLALDTTKRIEAALCTKGPWTTPDKEIHCGKIDGVVYVSPRETIEVKRER